MYREIPSIYRVQYNLVVRHVLGVLEHIPWGYGGTTLLPSMMHRPKLNFLRNILKRSINWNLPKAICPNGLYYAIMNKYSKTIEHLPFKGDWGLHICQFITLPGLERWYCVIIIIIMVAVLYLLGVLSEPADILPSCPADGNNIDSSSMRCLGK